MGYAMAALIRILGSDKPLRVNHRDHTTDHERIKRDAPDDATYLAK